MCLPLITMAAMASRDESRRRHPAGSRHGGQFAQTRTAERASTATAPRMPNPKRAEQPAAWTEQPIDVITPEDMDQTPILWPFFTMDEGRGIAGWALKCSAKPAWLTSAVRGWAAAGADSGNPREDRQKWLHACMARHRQCDWGDVDDEDRALNDLAPYDNDHRAISQYKIPEDLAAPGGQTELWVITDPADQHGGRSTTLLFPNEY